MPRQTGPESEDCHASLSESAGHPELQSFTVVGSSRGGGRRALTPKPAAGEVGTGAERAKLRQADVLGHHRVADKDGEAAVPTCEHPAAIPYRVHRWLGAHGHHPWVLQALGHVVDRAGDQVRRLGLRAGLPACVVRIRESLQRMAPVRPRFPRSPHSHRSFSASPPRPTTRLLFERLVQASQRDKVIVRWTLPRQIVILSPMLSGRNMIEMIWPHVDFIAAVYWSNHSTSYPNWSGHSKGGKQIPIHLINILQHVT